MSTDNSNTETVTVGAMHLTLKNADFSQCIHCGAWAEGLKKPCPNYLDEVAKVLPVLDSLKA